MEQRAEHGSGQGVREHRLNGGSGGQCHHLGQHVEDLAVLPRTNHLGDVFGHHLRVAGQPGGMEGGLNQPTLPPMLAVRAGGETVAEGLSGPVKKRSVLVEDTVIEQNLAGQLRRAHHDHLNGADPDTHQVTTGDQGSHEPQRATQQRQAMTQ